jgi:hypothetical protein
VLVVFKAQVEDPYCKSFCLSEEAISRRDRGTCGSEALSFPGKTSKMSFGFVLYKDYRNAIYMIGDYVKENASNKNNQKGTINTSLNQINDKMGF